MLLSKLLEEQNRRTIDARLASDLPFFAENALKLRPKAGPLEPFVFNAAQRVLHDKLEQLKATTGVVRVLVLKARQLGISHLRCRAVFP